MLEEAIRKKIEDLLNRATDILNKQLHALFIGWAEGWITEAVNVIEVAIPIENNAYRRRIRAIAEHESYIPAQSVMAIAESLRALLPDIDASLIANFGNKVRAETFDDFLDHAEAYHHEGEKQAAGVLAGVVFEDTIRRICRDQNIPEKGEGLEKLINALTRNIPIWLEQVAQPVRETAGHGWRRLAWCLS